MCLMMYSEEEPKARQLNRVWQRYNDIKYFAEFCVLRLYSFGGKRRKLKCCSKRDLEKLLGQFRNVK